MADLSSKDKETEWFIDLYKHEDLLTWTKVKFIFTYNSFLIAAWAYSRNPANGVFDLPQYLLPFVGILSNFLFGFTLWSSGKHLTAYRNSWAKNLYGELEDPSEYAGYVGGGLFSSVKINIYLVFLVMILWFISLFI